MRTRTLAILLTVLVALSATANAETITFGPASTGSDGITVVAWDDTFLTTSLQGNNTQLDFWGTTKVGIIAIKDMLNPAHYTGASTIDEVQITSATLQLVHASGSDTPDVVADRIITNWLADAAGTNENDTERAYADSDTTTTWAGAGDFDAANDLAGTPSAAIAWNKAYRGDNDFNVTAIVAAIFAAEVNYGIAVYTPGNIRIRAFSSETTGNKMPSLTIVYTVGEPLYTLTVENGSGDGDWAEATVVPISADAATTNYYVFDAWTGDVANVDDTSAASTTIAMPAAAAAVTATYVESIPDPAGTIVFQEGGATPEDCDDTYLVASNQGLATLLRPLVDSKHAIFAFKGMIPAITTGAPADVFIESATLSLNAGAGVGGLQAVYCDLITTDWLADAAGTNEIDTTSEYADADTNTTWASGSFTLTGDTDASDRATVASWDTGWEVDNNFDVTDMVQTMFDNTANYGFAVHPSTEEIRITSSEDSKFIDRPTLTVTYHIEGGDLLTVVDGSGTGDYLATAVVAIEADASATAQVEFSAWVGDVTEVANVNAAATTITIVAGTQTITATYDWGITTVAIADGYLFYSQYADWKYDDANAVYYSNYPVDHYMENGNYAIDTEIRVTNSYGPGLNGEDYAKFHDSNDPDPNNWTELDGRPAHPVSSHFGNGDDEVERRAYLVFDIGTPTVTENLVASLTVYLNGRGSTVGTQTGMFYALDTVPPADGIAANWNYSDSDNNGLKGDLGVAGGAAVAWTTPGGDYSGAGVAYSVDLTAVDHTPVTLDVSALVQAAVDASETEIAIFMIADTDITPIDPSDDLDLRFDSISSADAGEEPTLVITEGAAPEYWPGDLNTDEIVNITDLNMVLIDWSKSGGFTDARSDANGDGTIDITDLNTVLIDWSKTGFQP